MERTTDKQKVSITFIILFHFFGFLGLCIPQTFSLFNSLVPVHLFSMLIALGLVHKEWNMAFGIYLLAAFLIGFFIEVIGVHTKLIFGDYVYGDTFGLKVFSVPLLIGTNWVYMSYLAGTVVQRFMGAKNLFFKSFIGASLMVLVDFFIEPLASALDYWHWAGGIIPWQNYAAWFVVSYSLLLIFYALPFSKNNNLSLLLYILQLLFFIGLTIHFS